jgi:hypothetical protein
MTVAEYNARLVCPRCVENREPAPCAVRARARRSLVIKVYRHSKVNKAAMLEEQPIPFLQ